jgi:hypothetical protein
MLKFNLKKNKKGQTGETISWVIATLVIIGVLLIFIYVSTLMAKVKVVTLDDVQSDLTKESKILEEKTSISNLILNNKNKETIEVILQSDK